MPTSCADIINAIGICIVLCLCNLANAGVVIPIDAPGKAFFASDEPTLTMLFEAEKPATATILFIPGGDGHVGLTMGRTEIKSPWTVGILIPLTKSRFNLVYVDNPTPNANGSGYPGSDRLDRIESVVKFYHAKLKVPIILFGHSNGSAAVMEFANRSAENRQLIASVVLSGTRQEYSFDSEIKFPVLIMHHKLDLCDKSPYSSAMSRFEELKEKKVDVKFLTIEGGEGSGPPCASGHHMYYKAYNEVVEALEMNLPK